MTNNTIVQDHRKLSEWSWARNDTGLPIDMVFNDGHRLSIIVCRYILIVNYPNPSAIGCVKKYMKIKIEKFIIFFSLLAF